MKYEILRVARVGIESLEIHPDAMAIGAGKDDRACLHESVESIGVLEPLTVIERDAGGYLVIDGVGRLASAKQHGLEFVPCLVVNCDDVRNFVLSKNQVGRKRSTGSRLLCYALAHQDEVIEGLVGSYDPTKRRHGNDELKKWMPGVIAERLCVSRKDVSLAAELLNCHVNCIDLDGQPFAKDDQYTKIEKVFNNVLQGALPVRRWKSAFAGAATGSQEGESGKDLANYKEIGYRAFKSLGSTWKNWNKVPAEDVPGLRNEFRIAIAEAPQCMRHEFADAINCTWSVDERKVLLRDIKAGLSDK